jgi:hypothetical protein
MIGKIKRLELRSIWKNEANNFTVWMESNIDSLSDALGFELTVIKREHSVGPFSVDLLANDEYGNPVIIENQLEKTDHGHLGQILTYCTNFEDAKTCVWISKEPRQEHVNAINWLNKETPLNFYLLKVEAISIDDSKPAPLFHVICRPDEEIRSAVAVSNEVTDRGKFNIEFWTEVNQKCESKLPGFLNRSPKKYGFHSQASGKGGISYNFLAMSKYYAVELYIDTQDSELNEFILNQIYLKNKEVEKVFGSKLEYDPIPTKRACRIRYIIGEGDVMELDRNKVINELIENMVRLQEAIRPILKELSFDLDESPSYEYAYHKE